MSHWKVIARMARRCLIVLAVAIAIALSLYAGSLYLKNQAARSLAQAQQMEIENQSALDGKKTDLANLEAEIDHFSTLRQQGLVGIADRTDWVEQLKASQQRLGIQGKMAYTLQPPRPLAAQGTAAPGAEISAVGDTGQSGEPQFHDLEVEVANVHEGDLLALLVDYRKNVKGRFRVEACNLSGRTETGLQARCTLRFFTLAQASAPPEQQ